MLRPLWCGAGAQMTSRAPRRSWLLGAYWACTLVLLDLAKLRHCIASTAHLLIDNHHRFSTLLKLLMSSARRRARMCRFINGMKAQGTPLREARVLFFGAGSSAVGVATLIAQLIEKEEHLSFEEGQAGACGRLALPLPPVSATTSACCPTALVSWPSFACMKVGRFGKFEFELAWRILLPLPDARKSLLALVRVGTTNL